MTVETLSQVGTAMGWLDEAATWMPMSPAFSWIEPAAEVVVPTTAVGAAVWLFYRLFLRSDKRERDAFLAIKEQRDEWRLRAEKAEEALVECNHQLALAEVHLNRLLDGGDS